MWLAIGDSASDSLDVGAVSTDQPYSTSGLPGLSCQLLQAGPVSVSEAEISLRTSPVRCTDHIEVRGSPFACPSPGLADHTPA